MSQNQLRIENIRIPPLIGRTIDLPLGKLVAVVGASASGKSRLLNKIIPEHCADEPVEIVLFKGIQKHRILDSLGSVLGLAKLIAELFAATFESRNLGLQASDFQIENAKSRFRCPACSGLGTQQIVVEIAVGLQQGQIGTNQACETCLGRRFQSRVLKVRYNGRDIAQVLAATVEQALALFWKETVLIRKLMLVRRFGFSETVLGHIVSQMNFAEQQRLWLCKTLAPYIDRQGGARPGLLFLFDNPCLGLNHDDFLRIVTVFKDLVSNGHSVICIDNSAAFRAQADAVISLSLDLQCQG